MNNKPPPHANIHDALNLDGDSDSVKKYYAKWAETYEKDVLAEYTGMFLIGEILTEFIDSGESRLSLDKASLQVADMGCGTGLVGKGLIEQGYAIIDGMDISPEMIVIAREQGLYRELYDEIDINLPLRNDWHSRYDAVICCGVFTLGHVQPESLYQLLQITRPGGLVVASTRTSNNDSTHYQEVSDRIVSEGKAVLKKCIKDAPYTKDGDAHYWIYEVC
jgi:predicted TPR repeat methyltransferase